MRIARNNELRVRTQQKEGIDMTREIKVQGKSVMLYRVNGFDNAWCSDRSLALRIQRRRKQFLDELQTGTKEVREVAVKSDWLD
jgi:hypothetical protein